MAKEPVRTIHAELLDEVDEEATNEARGVGRPSSYKKEFAKQAKQLSELGATDSDLARFFGVCIATIFNWQNNHKEFLEALKLGKEAADDRVERSLYHRAIGYTHGSVKIMTLTERTTEGETSTSSQEVVKVPYDEHLPPDVTAGIFWLKNRRRDKWTGDGNPNSPGDVNFNFTLSIGGAAERIEQVRAGKLIEHAGSSKKKQSA